MSATAGFLSVSAGQRGKCAIRDSNPEPAD
jgi:hypothetical protein